MQARIREVGTSGLIHTATASPFFWQPHMVRESELEDADHLCALQVGLQCAMPAMIAGGSLEIGEMFWSRKTNVSW
jgi:hypothetical protein